MIYTSVSIKSVVAKLIRNTRINDSSYMSDLLEWIPEAMGMLRTNNELKPCYKTISIKNYHGKFPCGLLSLDAVEYEGARLREGSTQAHVASMPSFLTNIDGTSSVYITDTDVTIENHIDSRISGSDIAAVSFGTSAFYKVQMDYIQTSFEEGNIKIYFHKMPVDVQGYPLIPGNENYKEALYWYMRAKLIEAGWQDPLFSWDKCFHMWEHIYAPRAINEIRYPSVDRMERLLRSTVRLIPPQHFYTDFFTGSEQYQDVAK